MAENHVWIMTSAGNDEKAHFILAVDTINDRGNRILFL